MAVRKFQEGVTCKYSELGRGPPQGMAPSLTWLNLQQLVLPAGQPYWGQEKGMFFPPMETAEMATHSSIPGWKIPRTEEPGGSQSMGSQSQTRLRTHAYAWKLPGEVGGPSPYATFSDWHRPLLSPSARNDCSLEWRALGVQSLSPAGRSCLDTRARPTASKSSGDHPQ